MSFDQFPAAYSHTVVCMRGSQIVIALSGEQDGSNAPTLLAACASAVAQEGCDLVIDLSEVDFMSAATIDVLVSVREALALRAHSLEVQSPSKCARRVLELCNLSHLISEPLISRELLVPTGHGSALSTWVEVTPLQPGLPLSQVPKEHQTTLTAPNDSVPLPARDGT
jgi:anti-anti-sigma factor